MSAEQRKLTMSVIYRNEPPRFPSRLNVDDIDLSGLIVPMLKEPRRIADSSGHDVSRVHDEQIRISVRRQHEWRYVLEVIWSAAESGGLEVAKVFGPAIAGAVATRVVDWATGILKGDSAESPAADENRVSLEEVDEIPDDRQDCEGLGGEQFIDRDGGDESIELIARLFDEVSSRGGSVEIRFPPKL